MLRVVIQALDGHPDGLTTTQILERVAALGTFEAGPEEGTKAPYFRVKRAVDSLLKLGFVKPHGYVQPDNRRQSTYTLVAEAMDEALRGILRQALGSLEDQIHNQFPISDAAQLLAAFEDVLQERAERLGFGARSPRLGGQGLRIRKGDR